jgi:hypothetical protein
MPFLGKNRVQVWDVVLQHPIVATIKRHPAGLFPSVSNRI